MAAQRRNPPSPPVSGQQKIGNYLLRRQLGVGGMGVVWLAHDPDLDRDVAIKEMLVPNVSRNEKDATSDRAVQRFLREARSAAKLSHPNCVAIHHITRQRSKLYIVMEYVDGGSLTDLIRREGPLPWALATRLIRDAALGLAAAHEAGLVHRDIKPSNLLLTAARTGESASASIVKVADFGLARASGLGNSDVTLPGGAMLGTPAYMSPEQCRGDEANIDGRGDVYSLACTYYTLITGRTPFPDTALPALVHKQLTEPIPDPRAIVPALPEAIVHIIRRGTEKDLAKRYQSARDMIAALEAALTPVAFGASPDDDAGTVYIESAGEAGALRPGATALSQSSITIPNNLPHPVTSFVGREREIERATDVLTSGDVDSPTRLLTLTGAGGTGKTRLALTLARQLAMDSAAMLHDGAWWVELATVAQPSMVPQAIASAVGLREPAAEVSIAVALERFIGNKSMLLVLDNCEHIVNAVAQLCDDLLSACANLRVLATTRQALSIAGETTLRVPSLSVPIVDDHATPAEIEELLSADAVKLFAARAVAVAPGFALTTDNVRTVADICRRLDGIPLAIELAAARVKMLSVEQVAQRLNDRFKLLVGGSRAALPRQQTLRALIDWSHDLLDEREKTLLARLSVFAGGFTLEAAEAVCADDPNQPSEHPIESFDVLDLLGGLVDKSIVVAEEPRRRAGDKTTMGVRYRMLETLRAYAGEKLRERAGAGTESIERLSDRHAQWVLDVCNRQGISRRGSLPAPPMAVLGAEHDNIRAALDWCVTRRNGELAIAIVAAMGRYWYRIGLLREGLARCQAVLALPGAEARTLLRSQALTNAGILALNYDDPRLGATYHKEAWEIARESGNNGEIARASNYYGNVSRTLGDYTTALARYEEALIASRAADDGISAAGVMSNFGNVNKDLGRYDRSRELFHDTLEYLSGGADPILQAYAMLNVADLDLHLGNTAIGLEAAEKSRAALHDLADAWSETYAWEAIGRARFQNGDLAGARTILEESLAALREYGDQSYTANVLHTLGEVELADEHFDVARRHQSESLTLRVRLHELRSIIASIEAIARLIATEQRDNDADHNANPDADRGADRDDALANAVTLFAAAAKMCADSGVASAPCFAPKNAELQAALRNALGEDRFEEQTLAASAMSQEELVALALRSVS